ncbi:MAG: hypothetical protein KIS67_10980 [Verrucomicrobiae bacterium]|nr:hypothetical protein [Verrucomicrobiae bacterium]
MPQRVKESSDRCYALMETEAKIVTLSYNCQLPYIVKGHDKGNTYKDAAPTALAFVAPLRALLKAP